MNVTFLWSTDKRTRRNKIRNKFIREISEVQNLWTKLRRIITIIWHIKGMDRTQITKNVFELKCKVTNPVEFLITLDNSKMRGKSAWEKQQREERVDTKSKGWNLGRKKKKFCSVTCIEWKQRTRKMCRLSYADSIKRDIRGSQVILNQKFYFVHGFTHDKTVHIENITNKRNKNTYFTNYYFSFLVSKFRGSVQELHNWQNLEKKNI